MRYLRAFLLLAIPLSLLLSATAQGQDGEKWRNFEVVGHAGLTFPTGELKDWKDSLGAKTGAHFGLSGGYYFTEAFCTGLYFSYSQMGISGGYDLHFKMYDLGVYAKYAFISESNFEPYLKLTAGANWVKLPTWVVPQGGGEALREQSYDPDLSLGGYIGVLYYSADYAGIFLEVGYHNDQLKITEADYKGQIFSVGDNLSYLEVRIGVVAFFGPEY